MRWTRVWVLVCAVNARWQRRKQQQKRRRIRVQEHRVTLTNSSSSSKGCDFEAIANDRISDAILQGRSKFESCAVVGSSGRLLNSDFGAEIDAHEFVVRANNAPTFGYEDDVGGKTSMMILSSGAIRQLKRQDARGDFQCPLDTSIFYTSSSRDLRGWIGRRCVNVTDPSNLVDIRDYMNSEELGRPLRSPTGNLMAGPTAILLSLRVCANPINLYGFTVGNVSDYAGTAYHYYDNVTAVKADHIELVSNDLDSFFANTVPGCINVRDPVTLSPAPTGGASSSSNNNNSTPGTSLHSPLFSDSDLRRSPPPLIM